MKAGMWLLQNVFRPGSKQLKHSFQHAWLKQFSWLSYSITSNGGFFVNCVLFA